MQVLHLLSGGIVMKMKRSLRMVLASILMAAVLVVIPSNTGAATLSEAELAQLALLQQQQLQAMAEQAAAAQAAQAAAEQAAAAQAAQAAAAQAAAAQAAAAAGLTSPAGMPQTYVDINLTTQTLTYYLNGVAVLSSPCVTGKVSAGNATPTGTYSIKTMIPGKRLKGPTWDVWVNYWMAFNGNIGIHDASWRRSFGGNIYQTNGSHGCVNLPSNVAAQLYGMVGIGTPVIVHN